MVHTELFGAFCIVMTGEFEPSNDLPQEINVKRLSVEVFLWSGYVANLRIFEHIIASLADKSLIQA